MTERAPISQEVLDMEKKIIANPAIGERMIESMGTLSVVLSIAEFDLVCQWIQQGRGQQEQVQ